MQASLFHTIKLGAISLLVSLAIIAGLGKGAWANDGMATLVGGGLRFQPSEHIQLVAQELKVDLGAPEVSIRYEFRNTASHTLERDVAFPLPIVPYHVLAYGEDFAIQQHRQGNQAYVDFQTDSPGLGAALPPLIEVVYDGEVRATRRIDKIADFWDQAQSLFESETSEAERSALYDLEKPSGLRLVLMRKQHFFPSGTDGFTTLVTHRYTPLMGAFVEPVLDPLSSYGDADYITDELRQRRCLDTERNQAQVQDLARFRRGMPETAYDATVYHNLYGTGYFSYILSSAITWAGPIQDFQLEIIAPPSYRWVMCDADYGLPTFTPQGVVYARKNFVPSHELDIDFVDIAPFWLMDTRQTYVKAMRSQALDWRPKTEDEITPAYTCKLKPLGDNYLSVRKAPSSEGTELAHLAGGVLVHVLGSQGAWKHLVIPDGRKAWAYGGFLCD